jgi:hypothetical protein
MCGLPLALLSVLLVAACAGVLFCQRRAVFRHITVRRFYDLQWFQEAVLASCNAWRARASLSSRGNGKEDEMGFGSIRYRAIGLLIVATSLSLCASTPVLAGVVDGVQTVQGLKIYLGAVPAAVVRAHSSGHAEAQMHGGVPARGQHAIHLVVAVFDDATGARITKANVSADIIEDGGKRWSITLKPMTIAGALTYGGYGAFADAEDYRINVRVTRVRPSQPVVAQFTYAHD